MTTTTVSDRTALLNAIGSAKDGDFIRLRKGPIPYEEFLWPKNTTAKMTLIADDPKNPPVLRGIRCGSGGNSGNFAKLNGQPAATQVENVTFDGIRFEATRMTRVKQKDGSYVPTPGPDGKGYGWRIDYSWKNCQNLGDWAGMTGLRLAIGTKNISVFNCTFNGYAKAINVNGVDITICFNRFEENCEDMVITFGVDGFTFEHNISTGFRGLSYKEAHEAFGWEGNGVPPHADYIQIACNSIGQRSQRLKIRYNELYDTTCRVHGVLLNNALSRDAGGTNPKLFHSDVEIDNNFFDMTHTTAIYGGHTNNLKVRRNKINRNKIYPSPPNPAGKNDTKIEMGNVGGTIIEKNIIGDVEIAYNVCRKITPDDGRIKSWNMKGNVEVNDLTTLPDGFVEIRADFVKAGQKRVGPYGDRKAPIEPEVPIGPKPATLAEGDVFMFGTVHDANWPPEDLRQTGVFAIPVGSAAYDSELIKWLGSSPTAAPKNTVYLGTGPDEEKLYQMTMSAGNDLNLSPPGETWPNIGVYHGMKDGPLSDRSTVTLSFTTPKSDDIVVQVVPKGGGAA
jgi:hypothetical protein